MQIPCWDDAVVPQSMQVPAREYTAEYQAAAHVGMLSPTSDLFAVGVCIRELVSMLSMGRIGRGSAPAHIDMTATRSEAESVRAVSVPAPDYRTQLLQVARALLSQDVPTQRVQGQQFVDWVATASKRRLSDPTAETGLSASVNTSD
jgi:hypothetical protein